MSMLNKIPVLLAFAFLPSIAWAKFDCRIDLSTLNKSARAAVTAVQLRDQLLELREADPKFERKLSPEVLVLHLITFAEGWRQGAEIDASAETVMQIANALGTAWPNRAGLEQNIPDRTRWVRRTFFYNKINLIEVLGQELLRREMPWEERARLFRKFVKDPRLEKNKYISVYALDPLLGLDSMTAAREERKLFGRTESDDLSDGQRKGLGAPPNVLWSNYQWLAQLMKPEYFRPGEKFVDIGSGIGRVAAFIAAIHPELQFVGLEMDDGRITTARAWASRFGLADRIQFEKRNLEHEDIPEADHYYFFNALSKAPYERMLNSLRHIAGLRNYHLYVSYDPGAQIEEKFYLLDIGKVEAYSMRWFTDPDSGRRTAGELTWDMHVYRSAGAAGYRAGRPLRSLGTNLAIVRERLRRK